MRPLLYLGGIGLLLCANLHAQIVLTEVMFDPAGNENYDEFVEIFNLSFTDTVDLQAWRFGDQSETDALVSTALKFSLAPRHFAIILDAGYRDNSGYYDALIPPDALRLTIDDAAFGSGGLSNSIPETALLISSAGDTIASYHYSLGNAQGYSDEKILLSADDSPSNWGNARRFDGTPGSRNSLAPAENDLALAARQFSPQNPQRGQLIRFEVTVHNLGLNEGGEVGLHVALEHDSRKISIDSLLVPELAPGDSIILEARWLNPAVGKHRLAFFLTGNADENPANDSARIELAVSWPAEIVRFNEIMFAPSSGQAEWLEIFNPTDENISLSGWRLQDESGRSAVITDSINIAARGYVVIGAATSVRELYQLSDSVFVMASNFPTLNNEGDLVRLLDFSGAVIDSLFYEGAWGGGTGISLEKVWHDRANDAMNWLPSLALMGATPGAFNSRSPRGVDAQSAHLIVQPEKPRAGESIRLSATVYNAGRIAINSPAVLFFSDADRNGIFDSAEKIGEVVSSVTLRPEDSLDLSFEISNHPSGRFRVAAVCEIPGDENTANDSSFTILFVGYAARSLVINEILYDSPNEVEWVELFNRSGLPVDVRGWTLADAGNVIAIPDTVTNFIVQSGEFFVLTNRAILPSVRHLILPGFPSLNNNEDDVTLYDFSGTRQDSVHYFATWGGGKGISLERINPELSSQEAENWSGCVNGAGSTPGAANSIYTPVIPQRTTIAAAPNPFSPDHDGHDDFAIIQFQLPVTTAAVHLKIYDMRGRLIRHLLNNAPVGAEYQTIWDGAGEDGETARMGIYILFLQGLNEQRGVVHEARTTVVLAKKL